MVHNETNDSRVLHLLLLAHVLQREGSAHTYRGEESETKPKHTHTNTQTNNQTTKQSNNQTTKQTTKQPNNQTTKQPNNQTTKQTNTCAAGCCLEAHLDGSGQKLCKVRLEPQGMPVDHNGVLVNAEQPLQRSESAGAGTGTAICKTQTQGHKATAHACITTTTTPSQRRAHLVELQESFKTV